MQQTSIFGSGESSSNGAPGKCPACGEQVHAPALDRCGKYQLFACPECELQFWHPRVMPDARWYEQMYGGRDQAVMPLEPGHKYFLSEAGDGEGGDLLDIGCGTGNFLAAAQHAGYRVTGTEFDRNAARFATERMGIERVMPLTISEFARKFEGLKFDVITFFEVLEHQAEPADFLKHVKACLKPWGTIALSVPNRDRWLTGPDILDYPPNHFLRWNAAALSKFLEGQGFEVASIRQQTVGVRYAAQMINMALRTGLTNAVLQEAPPNFRDVMQMTSEQAERALIAKTGAKHRILQLAGRMKHAACYPLAVAAFPYLQMRGYKGTYLYCRARLR